MHDLVGTAEIAEMLGVTRQWVHQLASRPDFPAPVAVLAAGHIWERKDIMAWMNARDEAVDNQEG